MNACPADADLRQIIFGPNSRDLESHLSNCALCQERLEELYGAKEISSLFGSALGPPVEQSPSLRLVIERLQSDSAFWNGGDSALGPGIAFHSTLPDLQPTRRDGFLGRLGDIDIRRVIGRGGMGVVFEGHDPLLDRTVAVKVLAPHLVPDAEAKNRFLREARAAAALDHENVVAIHAIDEANGMPFLVLQYVAGESLGERLAKQNQLPFEEVLRLGIQTAKGLAAAHEQGLVHRDIKPGNILLEAGTGNVRIADFGLAKKMGFDSLTEVGVVAGTPAYMSPEQAADGAVDSRSDLFGLGVVLYQTASGRLPFDGDSPYVVLDRIRNADPKPLILCNPKLPEWFCSLVHRLLEKNPEHRIGSAAELAGQLERKVAVAGKAPRRAGLVIALGALSALSLAAIASFIAMNFTAIPPTSPVVATLVGFAVEGSQRPYATLAEAIAAAPEDGIITVHGDGPYPSSAIRIENKKLSIRAAPGSKPRFEPESLEPGSSQFLGATADLALEGLDIHWPVHSPPGKAEEFGTKSVIHQSKGKLSIVNCRIAGGANTVCIGSGGRELTIDRCHLIAGTAASAGVGWKPSAASVRIENTAFEGPVGILVTQVNGPIQLPGRLLLNGNIIASERAIQIFPDRHFRQPMPINATGNVFDNKIVLALFAFRNFPTAIDTHDGMAKVLRERVSWTDEGNVYRKGTLYLTGNRPAQILSVVPSDLRKLEAWLEFWNQEKSKSIDGIIAFQPRSEPGDYAPPRLGKIDLASGPIPAVIAGR